MTKRTKRVFKKKKLTQEQLQNSILRLLTKNPKIKYNSKEIIRKLKLKNNKDSVNDALIRLLDRGQISVFNGKYRLDQNTKAKPKKIDSKGTKKKQKNNLRKVSGRIELIRSGAGYVICDQDIDDIYVPKKFIKTALHGDQVSVEIQKLSRGRRPEGRVVKVIKRANRKFVGNLQTFRNRHFVLVDHPKMSLDVQISNADLNGAKDGDRVVVEVTKYAKDERKIFEGKISAVLDITNRNELEMNSILINKGFDILFPDEVLEESEALNDKITEKDITLRRDMRNVLTFTIDPHDAKDFDDAISYQKLDDGCLEIGVHIADVTHFVKAGTALDEEAYKRSTSVYLVDRVCPMLPEKISNELCSLRPDEDKFTFSAVFIFNEELKIKSKWFGKTLTHSNRRFTYEEAQEVLETGKGDLAKELKVIAKVARRLRKERFKKGAINFETEEVRFKLDENKIPIGVYIKERKEANLLIEDFMLLANKEVAKFMVKKVKAPEIPFVFRVHDEPNPERLADFALFAKEMGVKMKVDTPSNISKSLNKLSEKVKEDESLKLLQPLAIRTMAKAEYTSDNIGHYGLAFDYYTHFTSPIRRYSDVLVHRLLYNNLEKIDRVNKENLEAKCKHISAQERKAIEAERESTKYKQVEYLMNNVGEEFEGLISGMIDKGLFVELKGSKAEGLIRFDTLKESFFIEQGNLKAVGRRTGQELKMGDSIRVRLLSADLDSRQIDLELIEA